MGATSDDAAFVEVFNAAFHDSWDFTPITVEEVSRWNHRPSFNPRGCFLLWEGDQLVGFTTVLFNPDRAEQTGKVMVALEQVLQRERPALLSVVGDVNSTLAAALVAAKAGVPLAHVEAGLRSFDRTMPEEVNRVVVDRLSDLLLTPSADADENLRREGARAERIVRVGNVMIDPLRAQLAAAQARPVLRALQLTPRGYAVCTLHRAGNVDAPEVLGRILDGLEAVQRQLPVIFPVHPRTARTLERMGSRLESMPGLRRIEPLGYLDFLCLTSQARLVLTDSGGL